MGPTRPSSLPRNSSSSPREERSSASDAGPTRAPSPARPPTFPRVLIIAHNALSDTQSNGKTIGNFFSEWEKANVAQIYLTTDVPDFTVCEKFFQLHDLDVVRRLFGRSRHQGRIVGQEHRGEAEQAKAKVRSSRLLGALRRNIGPAFRLAREVLWVLGGFKTGRMKKFIDDFDPEVVFFQSSNALFAYSLVQWICLGRGIPLVLQSTDDYVTGKRTLSPAFWLHLLLLKRKFRWAIGYASRVVVIGDKMAAEYGERFGGRYYVAMNSVAKWSLPPYQPTAGKLQFLFAGNLALNRWKVLAALGKCLEELSKEEGVACELSVYSLVEPDPDILARLENPPYSRFLGALDTVQLRAVIERSDVLVHVEAFDPTNRHVTRLSISTKIPEYLASGRCILAIGPEDVASVQYLAEQDLAVVVTSGSEAALKEKLRPIIRSRELRADYASRGPKVARERHDLGRVVKDITEIVHSAVENGAR